MSKFSEYLKRCIEASGESLLSISQSTGIERTSLQRALKGEKILPYKTAHTLAVHLQLSLEESRELFRLYDMQLQDEDQWRNRVAVSEFLNQLASMKFSSDSSNQLSDNVKHSTPSFEYRLIEGEYPVQNMISRILSWEICENPEAHFKMFLPMGMDFATILLKLWQDDSHFTTDHLFCFPANSSGDCSESVKILKQILPMCLTARDFYHPYYFYERPEALFANPLSHYIITPHYLILLGGDMSKALVHSSEELINYYSNHFDGLMNYCEPFVSFADSLQEILNRAYVMVDTKCNFFLMSQPCFGYSTTSEMVDKYFKAEDFPPEIYDRIIEHFSVYLISKEFVTVFSEKGLQTFIDQGIIVEYPDSFTANLDIEDRITFLKELRENISSGKIEGRIARPSALSIPDYLTVYIGSNGDVWFDTTRDFVHGAYYCNIHITEKSICHALIDFSKSIMSSQLLYSQEETLNILDEGINELEKMRPQNNDEEASQVTEDN